MNWYSKLTTAIGALSGVMGVLLSPDVFAVLPARVSAAVTLLGVVIAALSRGLVAWDTPRPPA